MPRKSSAVPIVDPNTGQQAATPSGSDWPALPRPSATATGPGSKLNPTGKLAVCIIHTPNNNTNSSQVHSADGVEGGHSAPSQLGKANTKHTRYSSNPLITIQRLPAAQLARASRTSYSSKSLSRPSLSPNPSPTRTRTEQPKMQMSSFHSTFTLDRSFPGCLPSSTVFMAEPWQPPLKKVSITIHTTASLLAQLLAFFLFLLQSAKVL